METKAPLRRMTYAQYRAYLQGKERRRRRRAALCVLRWLAPALAAVLLLCAMALRPQARLMASTARSALPAPAQARPLPGDAAQRHIVALDAGHGGVDDGAVGFLTEQEVTRQTVDALEELLAQDGRFAVVRTHTDGATIEERAAAAAGAGAELLLSIHCNSSLNAGAGGFECYAMLPGRSGHEQSVQLAQYLVAQVQAGLGRPARGASGVRYMYFGRNNERQVLEYGDSLPSRWARSFGLLESASCPAVLVEQFFVTNRQECAALGTPEGCAALAACYRNAILQYFELT